MDPANALEAVREAKLDLEEGADVRDGQAGGPLPRRGPAGQGRDRRPGRRLPCLGRVLDAEGGGRRTAGSTSSAAVLETLTAIRRAGADLIFTYYAKEAAAWL